MEQAIKKLESELQYLKERVDSLERESIEQTNVLYEIMNSLEAKEWSHPNSCVHNCNPWETWKSK